MYIVVIHLWVCVDQGVDVALLLKLYHKGSLSHLGGREGTKAWEVRRCRCRHVCSSVMLWMIVSRPTPS